MAKIKNKQPEAERVEENIIKEEAVNEEAERLRGQLARTLADYDNLVKRVEREREDFKRISSLNLILKLLSIVDGLEMAQEHLGGAGLAITLADFKRILGEEGLSEIRPIVGSEFNETEMEAVEVVDSGGKNNTVAQVSMVGWKYSDGSVIRHAKVKVFQEQGK